MPACAAIGRGRLCVVAGQHGDVLDAERAQARDGVGGAVAQRVADGDDAQRAVLVADGHGGLALALEARDGGDQLGVGGVHAEQLRAPGEAEAPADLAAHALAGDRAEALDHRCVRVVLAGLVHVVGAGAVRRAIAGAGIRRGVVAAAAAGAARVRARRVPAGAR